jgi:hypothetical protein
MRHLRGFLFADVASQAVHRAGDGSLDSLVDGKIENRVSPARTASLKGILVNNGSVINQLRLKEIGNKTAWVLSEGSVKGL